MAYKKGEVTSGAQMTEVMRQFFTENASCGWKLIRAEDSEAGKVKVQQITTGRVRILDFVSMKAIGILNSGLTSSIPSVSYFQVTHDAGLVFPCTYHILANSDLFLVVMQRFADDHCLMAGTGTVYDIFSGSSLGNYYSSSNKNGFSELTYFFADQGGSVSVRCGWFESSNGDWLRVGGFDKPCVTALVSFEKNSEMKAEFLMASYWNYNIDAMIFKPSSTVVFLPALLGKITAPAEGTQTELFAELPYMRVCSTKFHAPGEVVEYQSHRWIIFPNPTPGGYGFAFRLQPEDVL
ncbi:hypothetical protein [Vibrio cholerae]|uniref:hypothetical protein n=1 Tax=Vibrio cholerae TaxID=666 RepID=UPI001159A860|nr:hypothetical protein [Vibrio cholerae]TQQ56806.1 hypothetical protein FLL61_17325 [Vibrio cholerae]